MGLWSTHLAQSLLCHPQQERTGTLGSEERGGAQWGIPPPTHQPQHPRGMRGGARSKKFPARHAHSCTPPHSVPGLGAPSIPPYRRAGRTPPPPRPHPAEPRQQLLIQQRPERAGRKAPTPHSRPLQVSRATNQGPRAAPKPPTPEQRAAVWTCPGPARLAPPHSDPHGPAPYPYFLAAGRQAG